MQIRAADFFEKINNFFNWCWWTHLMSSTALLAALENEFSHFRACTRKTKYHGFLRKKKTDLALFSFQYAGSRFLLFFLYPNLVLPRVPDLLEGAALATFHNNPRDTRTRVVMTSAASAHIPVQYHG